MYTLSDLIESFKHNRNIGMSTQLDREGKIKKFGKKVLETVGSPQLVTKFSTLVNEKIAELEAAIDAHSGDVTKEEFDALAMKVNNIEISVGDIKTSLDAVKVSLEEIINSLSLYDVAQDQ